jgi:hypothetical protein
MRSMTDRAPLSRVTRALAATLAAAIVVAPVARPDAQGRPPIAIVGAHVLDGSGNAPFVGTVVFSGGRITAVGRQVDVPADAETIDGAGRAVLPGLIEPTLRLTADGLQSDAGRRRLGRALAAGITTAAIDGSSAIITLADTAGLPRLMQPPAIDAEPTLLLPEGTRQMRSGTVAVSLDANAAPAIAAVRTAKARLAFAHLATDDGALTPSRIAAAGVTPLEAVTAMTSGAAWALGLQSDRGLLAPGMRADLIVVAGDPSVTLDALGQVERVFLGGAAVDRETLLRPAPAPPAAPTAAAAPGPTTTAPAASAKAAPTTPATDVKATRASRGRGRAIRTPPAAPKAAEAPAASAPATVVEPVPTAAPLEAAPAPAPTATPAPAPAPTAAPASSPSTTATPDPNPAAAPASAVTAVVAARLREPLLDDFERGDAVSAVGPAWVGSASEGGDGAATTIIMGRVVKGLRDHALLVSARMGAGREPYARAALRLDAGDKPVDVSRFRGLRFDARGEGRYRIVLVTRGVEDGRYHQSYFSGSPLWTPVSIPFASVGQNGAGARVPWTGRDLVEVRFEMVRDAGKLGWLELDNVSLY